MSLIQPNSFHVLQVSAVSPIGSFLKTDADKDILLPLSEHKEELQVNDKVLVYVQEDSQKRLYATEKFEKKIFAQCTLDYLNENFKLNQEVDLIIYDETALGFKAVVNSLAVGILYRNEVFRDLFYAQSIKGYIKKIRDDGRIDLILQAPGHQATDPIALKIIEFLEDHKGVAHLTDRTAPEEIYKLFGVSKKKFKIALGGLYKKNIIEVTESGIRLLQKEKI
jgi:uncharacterized protein